MLKIREDIPLEELEKYGFRYINKMMWKRYIRGNLVIYESVNVRPEVFENAKLTPLINRVIYERVNYNEEFATEDAVYDLIQAGIAVKE